MEKVYVSITGLQLKGRRHFFRFWWHAIRSMAQAKQAEGNIASDARLINGVHHTRTVWRDEGRDASISDRWRAPESDEGIWLDRDRQDTRLILRHRSRLERGTPGMAITRQASRLIRTTRDIAPTQASPSLTRKRGVYEAAQVMLSRVKKWSWLKAWAMNIACRRGRSKAIVALARRLAVIMHRMWSDGSEFQWTRNNETIPV